MNQKPVFLKNYRSRVQKKIAQKAFFLFLFMCENYNFGNNLDIL